MIGYANMCRSVCRVIWLMLTPIANLLHKAGQHAALASERHTVMFGLVDQTLGDQRHRPIRPATPREWLKMCRK